MTQSRLYGIFSELPSNKFQTTNLSSFRGKPTNYKLYKSQEINHLLQEVSQQLLDDKDSSNEICVRFLVRTDKTLIFAKEGYPSSSTLTPAHFQMTGDKLNSSQDFWRATCLTAGNAFFDRHSYKLIRINNKSGDFQPSFDSLQFGLNAIFDNNVQTAEMIQIQQTSSKQEFPIKSADYQKVQKSPVETKETLLTKQGTATQINQQTFFKPHLTATILNIILRSIAMLLGPLNPFMWQYVLYNEESHNVAPKMRK